MRTLRIKLTVLSLFLCPLPVNASLIRAAECRFVPTLQPASLWLQMAFAVLNQIGPIL
jgi:hypothetical protein